MAKGNTPVKNKTQSTPRGLMSSRGMLYIMLVLAAMIIVFMVAIYPVVMVGAPDTAEIRIPRSATRKNLADSLTKHFGQGYSDNVMRLVKMRGTDLGHRHGMYRIEKGTNALAAMRQLTSGAQSPVKITINGYRSLPQMLSDIARKFDFSADSLNSALSAPDFLKQYGLTSDQAIALFVEDTYEAYWAASPRDVLRKFGDNYQALWNDANRHKAEGKGLSPADMMTVASITDEETNANSEKGTIGQLYINRLKTGMKLQADPTVRFALGDFSIRRVKGQDLNYDSPYNTYVHAGLPPGPIRTTSARTVNSILDARPHDYIYMCAKEDFSGTHNFAVSYAKHQQNAARYQQALDKKGITR